LLYTANKASFAFRKVMQQHYLGEVGKCEISSGFFIPKIIKIGSLFLPSYSKHKKGSAFFRHSVYLF